MAIVHQARQEWVLPNPKNPQYKPPVTPSWDVPEGAKKLRLKFVLKQKPQKVGSPIFHARPCVTELKGTSTLPKGETYTPGLQQTSLRIMLSLFLHNLNAGQDYVCKATDIKRAFLRGDPEKAESVWKGKVYVVDTPAVWKPYIDEPHLIINIGVEGLVSAPKIFRDSAEEVFKKLKATYDDLDPCFFVVPTPSGLLFFVWHGDDQLICGPRAEVETFIQQVQESYEIGKQVELSTTPIQFCGIMLQLHRQPDQWVCSLSPPAEYIQDCLDLLQDNYLPLHMCATVQGKLGW
eukprot:12908470-Prorocentrum_lima.AAC.1